LATLTENENNEKKGGKKGGRIVLIICLIAIIILLGIIIFLLTRKAAPAGTEETGPERETLVNEDNAEAVATDLIQGTPDYIPQNYVVTMNSEWNFEAGDQPSTDAYVENSTFNSTGVYFDVMLTDTQEVILESPIIPVGEHMEDIKLDKKLDAGTYDCVCVYHLVDEEGKTLTTVNVSLVINILN